MRESWKEITPRFIVSSGRTGTKSLVHLLNSLSSMVDARHEPNPGILKLRFEFGVGKLTLEKAVRRFLKIRKITFSNISERIYIESNPGLSSLIPVIRKVFPNYKIAYIVRDGRDWVRSTMSRGIYASLIDRRLLKMIPILRYIAPEKIDIPKPTKLKLNSYIRDLWRFRSFDFKDDSYYNKWHQMTQFEKLVWLWNKINETITMAIKNDSNAITLRFEDIFNDNNNGLKQLLDFLALEIDWETNKTRINEIFSKKINRTIYYKIPHWKNWDD
ncbi:hypothetical protein LCGC14_2752920, partial [marine sediment metagenome]